MAKKQREILAKAAKVTNMGARIDQKMRLKGFFRPIEIANLVGVHVGSVHRWISDNAIKSVRINGRRFIHKADLVKKLGDQAAQLLGITVEEGA